MRHQFVLDKRTNKLLEELAFYHAGNRSMVVREAISFMPIWEIASKRSKQIQLSKR
ncbi:MAG TPA: hypothetical protein VK937_11790 [Candidatus Limnocylindria bacterium]|nr:hypothetical protein [Candidatus Limnocylindria bacterium]